jgi:peptide/nickel transport system ATP-binding protein
MDAKMTPLLEVRGLRLAAGGRELLRGLDLSIQPGGSLAVVGESGSGKTLTALAIPGLLPGGVERRAGQILWKEPGQPPVDLAALSDSQLRAYRGAKVAMIFQEPMSSLNPVFRCGYQVEEAVRLHRGLGRREAREAVLHLFGQVRLPRPEQIYRAYPHEISGGQKQRVMIAMALAGNPALLIADEPTTALDVRVQKAILDLLLQLRAERQFALLFITHDLALVPRIAEEVLIMRRGEALERGRVEDLFRSPQQPYTRALLASRPGKGPLPHRLLTVEDFEKEQAVQAVLPVPAERPAYAPDVAPLLQVEELRTWYPPRGQFWGGRGEPVRAVDGVSLEIRPGETLGLVGESGCGKTTLGRSLLRLIEPTGGKVCFEGQDLRALHGEALRRLRPGMQLIFQDPASSLNPRMRIGEALAEPLRVHGRGGSERGRREEVVRLLEQVGLGADALDRYPAQFSGGQRQRIGIARALILSPRLVICDEAVSALDVSMQAQVLNLLKDLQEARRLAYLFISHDLSVIRFMSDRVMVMKEGRIVEEGETAALYASPQHPYTQELLAAAE